MLEEHLGGHAGYTHLDEGALDFVKDILKVKSMLDIGCGPGGMVQLANEKKINAIGIDGDYTLDRYDDSKFIIHDYTKGPIKKMKPKQFDCHNDLCSARLARTSSCKLSTRILLD